MFLKRVLFSCATICIAWPAAVLAAPALDDPGLVMTVMQFTSKSPANKPELKKRMMAMRDYLRKQPGYVENALLENRNGDNKPNYVGVSRWKSFKDWEALWAKEDFQKLVRAVGEVGDVDPGTFAPVK